MFVICLKQMKIPEDLCGDEEQIMLLVGRIPSESKKPLEIAFLGGEQPKEALKTLANQAFPGFLGQSSFTA